MIIDEHKQLTITMETKEDISDILKFYEMKNAFELPTFGGKTSENAKINIVCHSSITIVN